MKEMQLKNVSRHQLQQIAVALDAENGKLRNELATVKSKYKAVFSVVVAHCRRPRFKGWFTVNRSRPHAEFDVIIVPLLLAEESVVGWELKFEIEREYNEMRVTCVERPQGQPTEEADAKP